MAIYRIYPEKDTFISSEIPSANAGKDEILEIAGYQDLSGTSRSMRTLIKFSSSDISDVIDNKINTNSYQANLKIYLAEANELPVDFTIYSYPVYGSWDAGKGKFNDIPTDTSGVSWLYRSSNLTNPWLLNSFPAEVTGSYSGSQQGGGNWYTGSLGVNTEVTQSFSVNSNLDLNLDVTNITNLFYSSSIENNGFILKLDSSLENQNDASIRLRYFGRDTNTIYPPFLEFKWDDSIYNTGSLSVISSSETVIKLKNNKGTYVDEGTQRFRLVSKPKYPTRIFSTSSIYLTNYALPENSYWGIRDEFSNEMIIDFDTQYTKISCDSNGPYFDLYLDTFQPERYYRVLIKTTIDGSTLIQDSNDVFKVVSYE